MGRVDGSKTEKIVLFNSEKKAELLYDEYMSVFIVGGLGSAPLAAI